MILTKASSRLNMLKKINLFLTEELWKNSTFLSLDPFWNMLTWYYFGRHFLRITLKTRKYQQWSGKICVRGYQTGINWKLLKEIRWDILSIRRKNLKITHYHKMVYGLTSSYLTSAKIQLDIPKPNPSRPLVLSLHELIVHLYDQTLEKSVL